MVKTPRVAIFSSGQMNRPRKLIRVLGVAQPEGDVAVIGDAGLADVGAVREVELENLLLALPVAKLDTPKEAVKIHKSVKL